MMKVDLRPSKSKHPQDIQQSPQHAHVIEEKSNVRLSNVLLKQSQFAIKQSVLQSTLLILVVIFYGVSIGSFLYFLLP
ncbi:hypothetical protein [Thalassotalea atypica]|uniref:hypothetical protein n=1 Tax=Thalassotalea atypica TaxID=2054316 RepID=UPI0025735AD9|nr:hypothetical protein [Thalassotalea atypica]